MNSPTQKQDPADVSLSAAAAPEVGQPGAADSPCVAVCSTLFEDVCRGCGRTLMEVSNWVFMDDAEKQAVWVRIRAEGYPRRPGTT
jgi:predicted Fe-S protein YdhL (DUF1289 family)